MIQIIRIVMFGMVLMPSLIVPMNGRIHGQNTQAQGAILAHAQMNVGGRRIGIPAVGYAGVVSQLDKSFGKPLSTAQSIGTGLSISAQNAVYYGAVGAGAGHMFDKVLRLITTRISSGAKAGFYVGSIVGGLLGMKKAYETVTAANKEARTTFMQAMKDNNVALLAKWIQKDETILMRRDSAGRRALDYAAILRKSQVVALILNTIWYNFLLPDKEGKSTYQHLVENGYKELFDGSQWIHNDPQLVQRYEEGERTRIAEIHEANS